MQSDSEYNGETLAEKATEFAKKLVGAGQPSFIIPSKTVLKLMHRQSGVGRGRAHNGARTKSKDHEAKKRSRRAMAKASRKANRS